MVQASLRPVMFQALKDNWKPILFEAGTHNNIHICNVSYRENLTPQSGTFGNLSYGFS
jgi:hypothetical protein